MFDTMVPYHKVVSAARETAEKICAHAKHKIVVGVTTQGGDTASVIWGSRRASLNLPTMPADRMLSRAEANQIVGLIAHECCHVMHSDWSEWMLAVNRGEAIKSLTNGIEDVRIETAELKRKALPGLRDALSDTCVMMHGKSLAAAAAAGETIGQLPRHASYVIATLGRLANKYRIPNAAGLANNVAPPWRPAINHALQKLPGLRGTADARQLAEEVLTMLQQAAEDTARRQQQQPRQPRQKAQEGQDASGEAPEGQEGQDASGEAPEGQEGQDASGEAPEGQEGQDASGEAPEGQKGHGHGDLAEGPWLDASPTVDDIAERGNASRDVTDRRRSWLNQFREANCQEGYAQEDDTSPRDRILRPAVLADSVSRLVMSEACNSRERYLSAGRFDRRAMGRASWGAGNVFSRRVYAEGIATAVFLLVDGSSSMENDGRIQDARSLAYHLGQACDAAGALCAIGSFYALESYDTLQGFRITLRMAKDWTEPVSVAKLAGVYAAGTTPLSPAILAAAQALADVRDVQRRILLPITDGGCDLGPDAVRDACGVANAMGVEVGGIGIGGGTECAITFPIGVDLGSGANLSEAGLNLLVDMLERGRA